MAVAIHIPDRDRIRIISPRAINHRGLKGAVTIAQQHANLADTGRTGVAVVIATQIGHDQIRMAIAVQVTDGDRVDPISTRGVGHCLREVYRWILRKSDWSKQNRENRDNCKNCDDPGNYPKNLNLTSVL